ncbi:hypothetical protein IEQ34_009221 [Dendrobium chrysotoxum]|uniref:Bulb-type lectin domain-containing protein n=1 Tax=Dendrobium chrysotoxum TaxID=161865 RepID=A0AAV7GZU1_DENCH|nr:hypothetical protein IEQ34_009221 [Dendrobium chrysotoxum]
MATLSSSFNSSITIFLLFTTALLMMSHQAAALYVLYAGYTLYPGQSLKYNGYSFHMQYDCNLVLYEFNTPIWRSGTDGMGSRCILQMQFDGNLVVYKDLGATAVWSSNSLQPYRDYYFLILQRDGNVVIYRPGNTPIWSTKTR